METLIIYSIGFLSQALFFGRTIIQWFMSEKAKKVLSPTIFWEISLVASIFMLIYGILRNDAAILISQILVYFIYVRNLQLKGKWETFHIIFRIIILLLPIAIVIYIFTETNYSLATFFKNKDNPFFLMIWGIAAQLIFISRFFYQWLYSENKRESILPIGFWIISTIGSSMTLIYGILRLDPVLMTAHSLGIFVYIRNILIYRNKKSLFDKKDNSFLNKLIIFVSRKLNLK